VIKDKKKKTEDGRRKTEDRRLMKQEAGKKRLVSDPRFQKCLQLAVGKLQAAALDLKL